MASGRGRDLRLLVLTAGLAGSAVVACAVAGRTRGGCGVELVDHRCADGPLVRASRLEWADVDVVIVDFDGTIADSMGRADPACGEGDP